ncbi:MAG: hypothetical protein ACLP4V_31860 [Methylocella sp.]
MKNHAAAFASAVAAEFRQFREQYSQGLAEREDETCWFEEAVAAYREVLKEFMRERAPRSK